MKSARRLALSLALVSLGPGALGAQQPTAPAPRPQAGAGPTVPGAAKAPEEYVIGADDVLSILFWREKDMSGDVVVRPDGKITLPLLNDIVAAGLTTEQLREKVTAEAKQFIEDPSATVVLKQINSRKVYITGVVGKPGPYNLTAPTTVLQLIAMAGGVAEFARRKEIVIIRIENGVQMTFPFDYTAVGRKNAKGNQNILLRPGDTVVVP